MYKHQNRWLSYSCEKRSGPLWNKVDHFFITVGIFIGNPLNNPFTKIRGKEKVVVHKQHVGFDVEKSYRNLAVAF